ncbi:uncharacterized protein [Branchiostoma lanceolatum]|uniref:uncharacterized protein n=1 Tax=Branchiostoma lanceolatum TaxID=7740 RepID=UPI0034556A2C
MEGSSSLILCGCECGEWVSERTERDHLRKKVSDYLKKQDLGEKPAIAQLLEDLNDPRNGPVILNGSSSKWTRIGLIAAFFQLRADHPGLTQTCVSAIFALIKDLLDQAGIPNAVPHSYKDAESQIRDLLPKSVRIDACVNDCVLFRGENVNADRCPVCHEVRKDSNGKARKEFHHFPLIDTLKSLYAVPEIAKKLQEHKDSWDDEVPRYVRDIHQTALWKQMYAEDGFFKGEARGLAFGYSTDGGEPFQHLRIPHSIWPMTLKIYNFGPEVRDKTGFYSLWGIIPGPFTPKNMNTYHEVLVEEMLQLMDGQRVWDSYRQEFFTLTGDIIAYIFDWPGRTKCTCRQSASAIQACPYCELAGESVSQISQTTFPGNRRFLPLEEKTLRSDTNRFPHRRAETRGPPPPRENQVEYGGALVAMTKKIDDKRAQGDTRHIRCLTSAKAKIIATTGKTGKEAFAALPTYSIDRVQVDWMHTEKNINKGTVDVIHGSKSNFEEVTKMEQERLPPRILGRPSGPGKRAKGQVELYELSAPEKALADERIRSVVVPIGYDFRVRPLFNKKQLQGMKSIEWALLFTDNVIKYAVRGLLGTDQRATLFRVCDTFRTLGAPVVDMESIGDLEEEVAVTLSLYERDYPQTCQTLMAHLPLHIPAIIKEFGPVTHYWMMSFERFMQFLLRRMTNKSHPTVAAVEAVKVHGLCTRLQYAGKMPTPRRDPVEFQNKLPYAYARPDEGESGEESGDDGVESEDGGVESEEDGEESEDDEETQVDAASAKLAHLKGTRPVASAFDEGGILNLKSLLSEIKAPPTPANRVVKYFAASARHPVTNRLLEYRCEEHEARRGAKRISSIVATKLGDAYYFGRIQHFLLVDNAHEMACIKWYGAGEIDDETKLWKVTGGKCLINPLQSFGRISKPLVHAFEEGTLFVLNLHSYDLTFTE